MRKLVYKTQCSRCEREELQEASPEELETPEPEAAESVAFYAALANGGEKHGDAIEVRFQDLCTPCRRTIKALLEQVGKKIEGVSPDRKPTEKAPPVKKPREAKEKTAASHAQPSEPNHTPPQPAKASVGTARA
jgi:hypothetical protein